MSLVFDRGPLPNHPITHALVIGCGRFEADSDLDRVATVAGARAIMALLAGRADDFVAPIWTIRCLISEKDVAFGSDTLGIALPAPAGGATITASGGAVEAATLANVEAECDNWIKGLKEREGDSAFLFVSSHGAGDEENALAFLEDVFTKSHKKWASTLNVTTTARGLGSLAVGRGWVFLDACQDIDIARVGAPSGMMTGHHPIEYDSSEAALARKTVALIGSHLGGQGWAPDDGNPSFFTQTLIEGLERALAEPVADLGWAVTGMQLIGGLPVLAQVLGTGAKCEPLTRFNDAGVALIKVAHPTTHVALTTEIELHLEDAQINVACTDAGVPGHVKHSGDPGLVWRFPIDASQDRTYEVHATFAGNSPVYEPAKFRPLPPGQLVKLKRAAS